MNLRLRKTCTSGPFGEYMGAATKIRLVLLLSATLAAPLVNFGQSAPSGAPPAAQSAPLQTPDPDAFYSLGPDSLPQPGVPKGEIRGPFALPSNAYPGT
jgi:hypothetical protein